jgi:hypothetical protein
MEPLDLSGPDMFSSERRLSKLSCQIISHLTSTASEFLDHLGQRGLFVGGQPHDIFLPHGSPSVDELIVPQKGSSVES